MRRAASEVLNNLEIRVARLEKDASAGFDNRALQDLLKSLSSDIKYPNTASIEVVSKKQVYRLYGTYFLVKLSYGRGPYVPGVTEYYVIKEEDGEYWTVSPAYSDYRRALEAFDNARYVEEK